MTPVIPQRGRHDCGIAALAMIAAVSYEEAARAISQTRRQAIRGRGKHLHNRELLHAARLLDHRLTSTRVFNLDTDAGILRVRWSGRLAQLNPGGHFVAVIAAGILCPGEGVRLPWRDYLDRFDARACTLLRIAR